MLILVFAFVCAVASHHPIIIVPGDGGSQLFGAWHGSQPHDYCLQYKSEGSRLWLDVIRMQDHLFAFKCLRERLSLRFNSTDGSTQDAEYVSITVPGWGNTSSVEHLDMNPLVAGLTDYFGTFVDYFVRMRGYQCGVNIRAAPYDCRRSINEPEKLWNGKSLPRLVENTYELNGKKSVVLVAHSMGNIVTKNMLDNQHSSWKKKYVKSFVSIAAPWGGAMEAITTMVSGNDLGLWGVFLPRQMRPLLRSFTSTALLMPNILFANSSVTVVSSRYNNFTISNYEEFFDKICYPEGYAMYKAQLPYITTLHSKEPGVPMECVYGSGVDTLESIDYRFRWLEKTCSLGNRNVKHTTSGDGTVTERSARGCEQLWQDVVMHEVEGSDHMGLVKDGRVLAVVEKVALV